MTKLMLALALGVVPRPFHQEAQPDVALLYAEMAKEKAREFQACEYNIVLLMCKMTGAELHVAYNPATQANGISTRQDGIVSIKDLPCGNWLIYTRLLANFEACEYQRRYWMAVSYLIDPRTTADVRQTWETVLDGVLGE